MALIINETLLKLAYHIENEVTKGYSTPRDNTLLKYGTLLLRPEIIRGITIDSVIDTLDVLRPIHEGTAKMAQKDWDQ